MGIYGIALCHKLSLRMSSQANAWLYLFCLEVLVTHQPAARTSPSRGD